MSTTRDYLLGLVGCGVAIHMHSRQLTLVVSGFLKKGDDYAEFIINYGDGYVKFQENYVGLVVHENDIANIYLSHSLVTECEIFSGDTLVRICKKEG